MKRVKGQIGAALYCVYLFPLLGPTARWTHVQLAVIAMCALMLLVWRQSRAISPQPLANT